MNPHTKQIVHESLDHKQTTQISSVSVIIPCFNSGRYLLDSVSSALNQNGDFSFLEVIVIDDRSDDTDTLSALADISKMAGVSVLHNHGPKGSAAARNVGIRNAKGEWIAFLDADDWWPLDSLANRFSVLEKYPNASWIGGDFIELNRDGTTEKSGRFERNIETYSFLKDAYSKKAPILLDSPLHHFLKQAPTHTIVTLVKRKLLEEIEGFDERQLRQQDYHLFLRLSAITSFVFVPRIVANYRHHESNSTKSLTHTQEWRIKALDDLAQRPEFASVKNILNQRIAQLHLSNSYEYRNENNFQAAALSALRCLNKGGYGILAIKSLIAALLNK